MSDWGAAFDEQCRAEGLEVPEKKVETKSSPSMDQNEENRGGFKSAGVGRGGTFGGPKMNALPPQTSFGAVSGTRMGGAFGSTGGVDGRGAPIGSSGEDGIEGNVISVGIHRERSALTRGGGFGTNRCMAPNPPATIKTNHEGGRFGTLAPRSLQGPLSPTAPGGTENERGSVGGRFGASSKTEEPTRIGGSFGSAKTATSPSQYCVERAFGSKSNSSSVTSPSTNNTEAFSPIAHLSSSLNSACGSLGFKKMGGSFGSSQSSTSTITAGGAFGAKQSVPEPSSTTFARNFGEFSTSSDSPSRPVGGGFKGQSTLSSPAPEVTKTVPTTVGGGFGGARVGGAFGATKTNTTDSHDASVRLSAMSIETTPPTGFLFGGGFPNRSASEKPTTEPAFGNSLQGLSCQMGGSFGAKKEVPSRFGFGNSENREASPFRGCVPSVKEHEIVGGGLQSRRSVPQATLTEQPLKETFATRGGSFGRSSVSKEELTRCGEFGGNKENHPKEQSTVGGGFISSRTSQRGGAFGKQEFGGSPAASLSQETTIITNDFGKGPAPIEETKRGGGFGGNRENQQREPTAIGGGFSLNETHHKAVAFGNQGFGGNAAPGQLKETAAAGGAFDRDFTPRDEQVMFQNNATRSKETVGGGFGKPPQVSFPPSEEANEPTAVATSALQSFSSPRIGGEEKKFGQHRFELPKAEETKAPFVPGQPSVRGGYPTGFRGGRGSGPLPGGQMDFAGQGQSMGRGRGQPTQSFAPQQSAPAFGGQQMVIPDPKYKYTKPVEEDHEKAPIPADIALLNKYIQKEVKMMKDTVVDVQRKDPNSPLYSISSFRELRLKPEVLQALDTLNFQFPTRIQETALPLLLMEPPSNLIAQAQSGTGKTAAFVLTMLCRIDVNLKTPQCICLAPTLELAKQIGEVVEKMGKYMENLKIHYAIKGGNMAAMRGRKLTEQIVIGTPGITRDYLQKYKCIDPAMIRCLVLDEADVMIYHQGFTDISTTIYNMVEEASDSVQSMLFSATYDQPVIDFATKIIKNAIVVMLKREEQALPNIKQFYVQCASRDSKYAAIVNLYSGLAVASSVIFCHTKASVMWLFENMKARGHQVDVLHGDMTVVERAETIIRFKRGDFKVLITTNVFARGIDVAQVSVVINYDLPIKYDDTGSPMILDGFTQPDCETYLHRIGRTGRFGKTGIAINLIDSENSMNMINILENHFQMKITRMDPSNLVELEAIEMA